MFSSLYDFVNENGVCLSLKFSYINAIKSWKQGFPGGTVVENPPANAGDMGSSPGLGRFPHAVEQLAP